MNAFLAIAILTLPQDKTEIKKPPKKSVVSTDLTPVTEAEAKKTFARVESLIRTVIGPLKFSGPTNIGATAKPIDRFKVAREFKRYADALEPYKKFQYVALPYEASRIRAANAADRKVIADLLARGFVGQLMPVASGPKDTLTTQQFGDAVGFWLMRAMDVTHTPSTKWTPYLHK